MNIPAIGAADDPQSKHDTSGTRSESMSNTAEYEEEGSDSNNFEKREKKQVTIDESTLSKTIGDEKSNADDSASHHEVEKSSSSTHTSEGVVAPKLLRRNVSFGTLHIREFPVAMGDNPSVQFGGPPIRLEYETQQDEYLIPIQEYEDQRQERRKSAELRVPASLRRDWVGHDPEIERQVALHRRQRIHSVAMQDYDDFHYSLERVCRGVARVFQRKKQSATHSPADHWNLVYPKKAKSQRAIRGSTNGTSRQLPKEDL